MNYNHKRYIIGIDLGTTNSAVSYVDLNEESSTKSRIKLFKVPQLTGAGEFSRLSVLPSFLYIPGPYDIAKEAITMEWQTENDHFVGAFARDHGSKVPARLVSSAKSWLCHSNADRRAKILPWGSGDEVYKVSPVQATAEYLTHIRKAWNISKGDDADLYMENQLVNITVPASFDEVARDLTIEAANIAGLTNVTLLEEPLAAFYSWLIRHEKDWSNYVKPNELILVCDVGGGTTDFTLITLREVDGSPRFERIAVGDHLILGGDNIDLALARRIEMQISKKKLSLSGDRWKTLCHQCRQAKEVILNDEADSKRITLTGTGAKLIADTVSAELNRSQVEETVLEGFFPLVDSGAEGRPAARKGITEFGLPYEQEPAITRHLGWFVDRHRADVVNFLGRDNHAPDLILFNGGSLKSDVVQQRIRAALRKWFNIADEKQPRVLENPNPDLAVALGASYYGLVKIGQGVRVGSGSARAYYLGVAPDQNDTEPDKHAVCLVERGLEEGSHIELTDKDFEVIANRPVSFDLYSSSFRSGDRCGDSVIIDDTFSPLPPLKTIIHYGKKGVQTNLPVQIEADYTEMGTLALWCRSKTSDHRWRLSFQLRDIPESASLDVSDKEVFETALLEKSQAKIREVFSVKPGDSQLPDIRELESLVKDLTEIVERPKEKWPLGFIRPMADELLNLSKSRQVKPEFEIRWLNLTGFFLRPGFGDGFDENRVKQLWKMHKNGPTHTNNAQVRSEWWILWRRIAGGLTAGQQRQFSQEIASDLSSKKAKQKLSPQELIEMWMALANMERLIVKDKIRWGKQLLDDIRPKKYKPQHFWSLSRFAARELLYGPVDRVIPPAEASSWIERILGEEWKNPKPVAVALTQMARRTGDRMRDIDDRLIDKVVDWISRFDNLGVSVNVLKTVVPMAKQEENVIFGEDLPSGLIMHSDK